MKVCFWDTPVPLITQQQQKYMRHFQLRHTSTLNYIIVHRTNHALLFIIHSQQNGRPNLVAETRRQREREFQNLVMSPPFTGWHRRWPFCQVAVPAVSALTKYLLHVFLLFQLKSVTGFCSPVLSAGEIGSRGDFWA